MAIERSTTDPNSVVRDFVSSGEGGAWEYGAYARQLYPVADGLTFYFLGRKTPDQLAIPSPLLAFARDDVRTLAHYKLGENPNGLKWEILFNTLHLNRPFYSLCETLMHELCHLYQESMSERRVQGFRTCRGGYHNKQFVEICEAIGLHPKLGEGWHLRPADGQFAKLMDRWCIAPPPPIRLPTDSDRTDWWSFGAPKPKGSSNLVLYTTEECTRDARCKLRSGRRDLRIECLECSGTFVPQ
jgi:hypothetical protein